LRIENVLVARWTAIREGEAPAEQDAWFCRDQDPALELFLICPRIRDVPNPGMTDSKTDQWLCNLAKTTVGLHSFTRNSCCCQYVGHLTHWLRPLDWLKNDVRTTER